MKTIGRTYLEATNGGLDIFNHYVSTPYELDELAVVNETTSFKIFWSNHYENFVVQIFTPDETVRYNAIWFVKEKYGLTEDETYAKIKNDLGILQPKSMSNETILVKDNPLNLIITNDE